MSPRWSRARRAVLVATSLAVVLLQPAAAHARSLPDSGAAAAPVPPASGSYLALVDKGRPSGEGAGLVVRSERLVLVNQAGAQTTLLTRAVSRPGFSLQLRDWSRDGSTALLTLSNRHGEQVIKVDVATGATQTLTVAGAVDATFLDPDGSGVVVTFLTNSRRGLQTWERVSWTGAVTKLAGKVQTAMLPGPGETVLAGDGAHHDVQLRSLVDGSLVRTIGTPGSCSPVRWWSSSQALMTCGRHFDLGLLDPATGATTRLTSRHGRGDYGHLDAREVASGLYVQVAGACGYTFVAHQTASGAIKAVKVPHAVGNIFMVDATATDLVLEHAASCDGRAPRGVLALFDPVARHETPFFTIGRHEQFSNVLAYGNVEAQY